jgi:vitamin B12 transporter
MSRGLAVRGSTTRMQRHLWWALVTWLLMWPLPVIADEPTTQLPEVVVTATRTETRADDATTTVSVIGGTDIGQRGQSLVADALRGSPGMDINEFGSRGQTAFASIRGSNPDQVLVLLDGVEVNTPTVGQFDFANLTTDNIDRIEILRGGGGALYGSEAIGGVVNVLTQRGAGPFHLLASAEGGSAGTHHETVGINGAQGPFSLAGTASFLASDGFRSINDDYRNFSTVWRADFSVSPSAELRGFLRYSDARAGLVNFNVAHPERPLDPGAYSRDNFFLAKGEWEHVLSEALNYRTAVSFVRDNPRYHGNTIDEEGEFDLPVISHTPSEMTTAEAQVNYLWHDCSVTSAGLEYKEQWADIHKLQPDPAEPDSPYSPEDHRGNRSIVGLYAQEQIHLLNDTLRGVGGVRYDHYDVFGGQTTVSGSASYLITPTQTRLRLGYAEGFRAPTFDELFGALGNPKLKSETSWEINAGLTQELFDARLRFEPSYFYREVHNLIEEVVDELPPVASVPENEGAFNVATTRMQGVEMTAKLQATRWLTLGGNYTYLNFVTATGTLVNRPHHRGSLTATGRWGDLFTAGDQAVATALVYVVGRRDSPNPLDANDPFSPASIAGYGRVDVALSYHFGGPFAPLAVTATARNLFNRDYAESLGFPAPPANFLAGLRYGF